MGTIVVEGAPVRSVVSGAGTRALFVLLLLALGSSACTVGGAGPSASEDLGADGSSTVSRSIATEPPSGAAPGESASTRSRNPAGLTRGEAYRPEIVPGDFVRVIDNPYMPLTPGLTHVYWSALERIEVTVTHDTKAILGVTTIVVIDRAFVGNELVEETHDWYAQDRWGNVWYFGEAHASVGDGAVVSIEGSWEAGLDDAQPGIVMLGGPQRHDVYRQEFRPGEAEDAARVLSTGQRAKVPYGAFSDVLVTEDWTPLEPTVLESKLYAAGVGMIEARVVRGGDDLLRLVEVKGS